MAIKQDILKTLLDWNPWLEGEFPQELLGYERDYQILSYLDLKEIKIIEGARRVGKSTLLYQVISQLLLQDKGVLYINFDDEILKQYSLSEIANTFLTYTHIDHLFIDEIQHCTNWAPYIRKIYDRHEVQQIWITGSNSSLIKKEYATLLTGRSISIHIHPLSFKEYLRFNNIDIKKPVISTKKQIIVKKHFNDFLQYGGFPAVTLRNVYKKELLINYFEDFVYKDICARYDVNAKKIKDLGIYLASNTTKIFSYRNIAQSMHVHPKTITDYFSYFKEIFLFDYLYKFDYSLKSQYGHNKKIYSIDTGLSSAISFRFSEDRGRMLENVVYTELKRRKNEIYFYKKNKECDFLIKQDLKIVQAIQVCHELIDPNTKKREFAGLIEALTTFKLKQGLVLTTDEEGEEIVEIDGRKFEITIVPVWKWLLSVGNEG